MRKFVFSVLAMLVAVLCLFPPIAFVEDLRRETARPAAASTLFARKIASLNLTLDQKAQVRRIFSAHEATLTPKMAAYVQKRREFRKLGKNVEADQQKIYNLADEIAALKGDLAVEKIAIMKEIIAVLTLEQAAKFKAPERNSLPEKD